MYLCHTYLIMYLAVFYATNKAATRWIICVNMVNVSRRTGMQMEVTCIVARVDLQVDVDNPLTVVLTYNYHFKIGGDQMSIFVQNKMEMPKRTTRPEHPDAK